MDSQLTFGPLELSFTSYYLVSTLSSEYALLVTPLIPLVADVDRRTKKRCCRIFKTANGSGQAGIGIDAVQTSIQPPDYQRKNVSDEAKDLLTQMMEKDPSKRLTVDECLAHSWFVRKETISKLFRAYTRTINSTKPSTQMSLQNSRYSLNSSRGIKENSHPGTQED